MKKFRIVYEGFHSLKEDIGDDFVLFDCEVFPEDEKENSFPVNIPFYMIKREMEDRNPAVFNLIQHAKKRVSKWGMNDSEVIHELEECGVVLEDLVIKLIEDTIDLEEEEMRWKNLRANPGQLKDVLSGLNEAATEIKNETEIYNLLCTKIEKVLSNEIVALFPVIINSSSECIRKLSAILVEHIPDLAEDLCNLIDEAEENKQQG
jgi:hypothetical protein